MNNRNNIFHQLAEKFLKDQGCDAETVKSTVLLLHSVLNDNKVSTLTTFVSLTSVLAVILTEMNLSAEDYLPMLDKCIKEVPPG